MKTLKAVFQNPLFNWRDYRTAKSWFDEYRKTKADSEYLESRSKIVTAANALIIQLLIVEAIIALIFWSLT